MRTGTSARLLIAATMALFPFVTTPLKAGSFLTAQVQPGCGASDGVFDYVRTTVGERSVLKTRLPNGDSRSHRLFLLYRDASYVVLVEFLGPSADADVTCVLASGFLGRGDAAYDQFIQVWTHDHRLPDRVIGRLPHKPEPSA